MVLAVVVGTTCALPAFLSAALAVRLRAVFAVDTTTLGLAFGSYFLIAGLGSIPAGRLVQRVGAHRGMLLAVAFAGVGLLGMATAPTFAWYAVALGLAALGPAAAQPATNLFLMRTVRDRLLGRAFALKQSAVPMATLVAGLSVPTLALLLGWRLPFVVALAAVVIAAWMVQRSGARPLTGAERGEIRAHDQAAMPAFALGLVAVTGGVGGGTATALATFLVDASVADGLREGVAGGLLAAASVCGVAARLGFGVLADLHPRRDQLVVVGGLLLVGSTGFGLLALGGPVLITVGAVVGYVLAWGWPGLLHLVVATRNRAAPASATGVLQVGISLGSGLGPLGFALVAANHSYSAAWLATGTAGLLAGAAALAAVAVLRREGPAEQWA